MPAKPVGRRLIPELASETYRWLPEHTECQPGGSDVMVQCNSTYLRVRCRTAEEFNRGLKLAADAAPIKGRLEVKGAASQSNLWTSLVSQPNLGSHYAFGCADGIAQEGLPEAIVGLAHCIFCALPEVCWHLLTVVDFNDHRLEWRILDDGRGHAVLVRVEGGRCDELVAAGSRERA